MRSATSRRPVARLVARIGVFDAVRPGTRCRAVIRGLILVLVAAVSVACGDHDARHPSPAPEPGHSKANESEPVDVAPTPDVAASTPPADTPTTVAIEVRLEGAPVADAKVALAVRDHERRDVIATDGTDASGVARVEVPAGIEFEAYVAHAGRTVVHSSIAVAEEGRETIVQVALPELTLSGVLRDAQTGAPVPDTPISGSQRIEWPVAGGLTRAQSTRFTTSDATGRFEFGGLRHGPVDIEVRPGRTDCWITWSGDATDFAGSRDVLVALEPVTVVALHVTSGEEDLPLGDVRVSTRTSDGTFEAVDRDFEVGWPQIGRSQWPPDGHLSIPGAGPHRLLVAAMGCLPREIETSGVPGGVVEARVVLDPCPIESRPRMRLHVVSSEGDLSLPLDVQITRGRWSRGVADTLSDGVLETEILPGPNRVQIGGQLHVHSWRRVEFEVTGTVGQTVDHEVGLEPIGEISVREDVFSATATRPDGTRVRLGRSMFARARVGGGAGRSESGVALTADLAPGTWTLTVRSRDGDRSGEVTVVQGETTEVDIESDLRPVVADTPPLPPR
jgi:hypothetical protein